MPVSSCSIGWCWEKADCSACSWGCIMWLFIRGWDQPDMASAPTNAVLSKNKKCFNSRTTNTQTDFTLTRGTANAKWPNSSLTNRCCVAGGEQRWIDWTCLPYSGQPLCADGWRYLPVLVQGAARLLLGRRGNSCCGKSRGGHCRGRWDRWFTCL